MQRKKLVIKLTRYVTFLMVILLLDCKPKINNVDNGTSIGVSTNVAGTDLQTVIQAGSIENQTILVNQGDDIMIIASGNDEDGVISTKIKVLSDGFLSKTQINTEAIKIENNAEIKDGTEDEFVKTKFLLSIAYVFPKDISKPVVLGFEATDYNGTPHLAPTLTIYFLPEKRVLTPEEIRNSRNCSPRQELTLRVYREDFSSCSIDNGLPDICKTEMVGIVTAEIGSEVVTIRDYCDGEYYYRVYCDPTNNRIGTTRTPLTNDPTGCEPDGFTYECYNGILGIPHLNGANLVTKIEVGSCGN